MGPHKPPCSAAAGRNDGRGTVDVPTEQLAAGGADVNFVGRKALLLQLLVDGHSELPYCVRICTKIHEVVHIDRMDWAGAHLCGTMATDVSCLGDPGHTLDDAPVEGLTTPHCMRPAHRQDVYAGVNLCVARHVVPIKISDPTPPDVTAGSAQY